MRASVRSLGLGTVAFAAVLALGWSSPIATVVQLLGTTAFIMGGTQHPLVNPNAPEPPVGGHPSYATVEEPLTTTYVNGAQTKYVVPSGADPDDNYNVVAVWTPEEFFPTYGSLTFDQSVAAGVANLDACIQGPACTTHIYPDGTGGETTDYAVFGYSQSAHVATIEKRNLIGAYEDSGAIHHVAFVLTANPNRPNGGVLERFNGLYIPILEVTFDGATPTNSPVDPETGEYLYPTADIAREYDGWTDLPVYPLNLLADANAVAGIYYLHGDYFVGDAANPVAGQKYLYQGQYGDTNYYMIATQTLPILLPLAQLGVPAPILAAMDAPMRVMVEWGYDRSISPGTPTPAKLIRLANPLTDLGNLVVAIPTGWDDGISMAVGDPDVRPFDTEPVSSPYGVGGTDLPEVDDPVVPAGPADAAFSAKQTVEAEPVDAPKRTVSPFPRQRPLVDLVRNPIGSDAEQPKVIRRAGDDGPLRKLAKALTGQRPTATDGDASAPKPQRKLGPRHLRTANENTSGAAA